MAGLLTSLSTFGAEERAIPIPGVAASTNNAADILWLGMHEAGMIDDDQFLYVQENEWADTAGFLDHAFYKIEEIE